MQWRLWRHYSFFLMWVFRVLFLRLEIRSCCACLIWWVLALLLYAIWLMISKSYNLSLFLLNFLMLVSVVTRLFKSWLQRLCPQLLYRFGWKTVLFALFLMYNLIFCNKILLSLRLKKKKK